MIKSIKRGVLKEYPDTRRALKALKPLQSQIEDRLKHWLSAKFSNSEALTAYFEQGIYKELRVKVSEKWAIRLTLEVLKETSNGSREIKKVASKYGFEI
jgi:hypothetical protein